MQAGNGTENARLFFIGTSIIDGARLPQTLPGSVSAGIPAALIATASYLGVYKCKLNHIRVTVGAGIAGIFLF